MDEDNSKLENLKKQVQDAAKKNAEVIQNIGWADGDQVRRTWYEGMDNAYDEVLHWIETIKTKD